MVFRDLEFLQFFSMWVLSSTQGLMYLTPSTRGCTTGSFRTAHVEARTSAGALAPQRLRPSPWMRSRSLGGIVCLGLRPVGCRAWDSLGFT